MHNVFINLSSKENVQINSIFYLALWSPDGHECRWDLGVGTLF